MQKEVFSKINYVAFITSGFGFMFKILLFSFLFFFFAILLALCKYPHLLQYFIVRFMVRLKISMYLFDCCVEKPLMAVTIQSL